MKKAIEVRTTKTGRKSYYVDGKRVSRDKAIEIAAEQREGNLFTVMAERRFEAPDGTVEIRTNEAECKKLETRIGRYMYERDIEVNGEFIIKVYSDDDARAIVDRITEAYLAGYAGCKINVDGTFTVIESEANPADYAITNAAFREAVTGEVKAAYAAKLATEREEIMSTPLTTPEALDAAVEAETELASAAVQKKSATRAEILAELAEINADDSGISVDEEDIEWNRSYTEEELAEFERILLEEATESERAAYFAIKLEGLKARQENARALADMAQEALRQAQAAVEAAENALLETNYAIDRLYRAEAERQVAKLEGLKVAGIKIISQNRVHSGEAVDNWGISTLYGKFSIFNTSSTGYIACGNYETLEQVTRVIEMLTAAVNAGKNEFTFPTLEELDKANFTFDAERFGQGDSPEDDGSNGKLAVCKLN